MNNKVGWLFPPTNGGVGQGFNDSGIAHFVGTPMHSLARETIQNSLDARVSDDAVHVSFESIEMRPEEIGRDELTSAIDACKKNAKENSTEMIALDKASLSIGSDKIACLRISDRNTTGLCGDHWRALVKMQGLSFKQDVEGAGGSHGIGKFAPFAVSAPRTVFYWTCFSSAGSNLEKFQGKSVLMSHEDEAGNETQGTGFYGLKKNCEEITDHIPRSIRILDSSDNPIHGTSVAIVGFRETTDWKRRVAASAVANFFYAIGTGKLSVIVEPEESGEFTECEINSNSLDDWFQYLVDFSDPDGSGDSVREAQTFWELSQDKPVAEKQDNDLGHCRLWIRTAEGLPSKVGIVRRIGMLITTQLSGLIRFSGYRDFAALCVFDDPAGNELLRRMENPAHDRFEPKRLPEDEQARGRRALKRITDWIREEIKRQAGPPEGGPKAILSELAAYLPDYQPEEPFDADDREGKESGEPGFGERISLKLKPTRRVATLNLPLEPDDGEDSEGDGDDTGTQGGAGEGTNGNGGDGGPGEGAGQGGSGTRGGDRKQRNVPVSQVRILPITDQENCFRLVFVASADGIVSLTLDEAGDSSVIRRDDVCAAQAGDSLERVSVKKGQRTELDITADGPIDGRAWRLSAATVSEDTK